MDNREPIHSIWGKFQSGNKEAFAFLYNNYINSLYRYGTKICSDEGLVKDAIQEVFIDLYTKRKGNNSNPKNLKFYLILALKRNLIRKIKKNRKLPSVFSSKELLFEPEYCIEKKIIDDERNSQIHDVLVNSIKKLPKKQKEAVYLRFNESLEYEEIAEVLNISAESVRKQVYRAIKTLRNLVKKQTLVLWLMFSG